MNPQETLSVRLPAGRMVHSDTGEPLLWLSDEPASPGLWSRLRAEHPRSGLWPLLLHGLDTDPVRPWESQELFPSWISSLTDHDPAELLARWWNTHTRVEDGTATQAPAQTAPYRSWPGPAPAVRPQQDSPDAVAAECAELLVAHRPGARLGLVKAASGAEAMTASGWAGPLNQDNDTAVFAAVVADWEKRFGVRVLGMGFATLTLSVAAPPVDIDHALRVAAEHFAFCPDNIWQSPPHRLRDYADLLLDRPVWDFWWD